MYADMQTGGPRNTVCCMEALYWRSIFSEKWADGCEVTG